MAVGAGFVFIAIGALGVGFSRQLAHLYFRLWLRDVDHVNAFERVVATGTLAIGALAIMGVGIYLVFVVG